MSIHETIVSALKENGIHYSEQHHAPMHSVDDALQIMGIAPGQGTKTLLLKAKEQLVAVSILDNARLDLKAFAAQTGLKKLSFLNEEELQSKIGIAIGSAAPLGYAENVTVFLENAIFEQPIIYFNPRRNDATFGVTGQDLKTLAGKLHTIFFAMPA